MNAFDPQFLTHFIKRCHQLGCTEAQAEAMLTLAMLRDGDVADGLRKRASAVLSGAGRTTLPAQLSALIAAMRKARGPVLTAPSPGDKPVTNWSVDGPLGDKGYTISGAPIRKRSAAGMIDRLGQWWQRQDPRVQGGLVGAGVGGLGGLLFGGRGRFTKALLGALIGGGLGAGGTHLLKNYQEESAARELASRTPLEPPDAFSRPTSPAAPVRQLADPKVNGTWSPQGYWNNLRKSFPNDPSLQLPPVAR